MSSLTHTFLLLRQRLVVPALMLQPQSRNYAAKPAAPAATKKKKLGKLGPIMEKKIIPVETDANKLVSYVCGSNYFKTGEDVKLKPDAEYPDWLWTLNTERIVPLDELDPDTKQYWRRLRKMALRRNNQLSKLKKF
ncbi:39S ribosomal protein L54, mitochondrial [Scaptodrosophila lebanonensis]|uniref:Large ribosomal subunit protein mL54 n=1 Tax=Drosophila lebanonensis TaxID=7225 RepID=A0A6J2UJI4_DROLE|nr:39S ribosomal protein L54, mitochondrial [Scaptodrosophila lebanonensis]